MIASRFCLVRIAFYIALFACGLEARSIAAEQSIQNGALPNNFPFLNQAGTAATYSTEGFVDLANAFHLPQGQNGRTCESCHLVHAGWSVRPVDVELRFLVSGGKDPLFNLLDANSPNAPTRTLKQRYAEYSMLRKGLFRRGGDIPATAEFEIVAVDDPLRAGGSLTRIQAFRRPLATANFHIAKNVGWHDQNANGSGDLHAGLVNQATGAITGAEVAIHYEVALGFEFTPQERSDLVPFMEAL